MQSFVYTTQGHASQILQNRPHWEDGWRLPCCSENLMTDGLSSGEEQEAELLGERTGKGAAEGPVSRERPCRRGWRSEERESPATPAGLSHIVGRQSHHSAGPLAHRPPAERPAFCVGPSQSSPTPLQPRLPQAACLLTIPFTPLSLHLCSPLPASMALLSQFHPCKAGFHSSLLSLVADTVLTSSSHPGGRLHAYSLHAWGVLSQ